MKKIFWIPFLLIALNGLGQDFTPMVYREVVDCSTISEGSADLFQKFYIEGKLDSAQTLLTYWQEYCGLSEPIYRARLLLAFKQDSYHDSLLTPNVISFMLRYKSRMAELKARMEGDGYPYEYYGWTTTGYQGYVQAGRGFDRFTKKEFGNFLTNVQPYSTEQLLCEHYVDGTDTIFVKLQDPQYGHSILSERYYDEIERLKNESEGFWAFNAGVWIPTGDIRELGLHPDLGLQFGVKKNRWNYGVGFGFKFLESDHEYTAFNRNTGEDEQTTHFFGGKFEIFGGRDVLVYGAHELQLTAAFGIDGFDAINTNQNDGEKSVSIVTPNLNVGLEYRFYFKPTLYLGLRAQYHIVDYTLNNVIDLKGHPFTVHLTLGGINNYAKHSGLRAMKYKFRK